jgi:hypothetical protein
MPQDDLRTIHRPGSGQEPHQDFLAAENVSLRLLLEQAEINSRSLLAKAGIDAREREASDKLQKLILEELHHRIKNTLATVGAIVSQSLRNLPGVEHFKSIAFERADAPDEASLAAHRCSKLLCT